MYFNTFVDVGRIEWIERVGTAGRRGSDMLAVGERGECRFFSMNAYSKIIPDVQIGSDTGKLFDLGVIAFFQRVRSMLDGQGYLKRLKLGTRVLMPDQQEALHILRSVGMGGWSSLMKPRKWINASGDRILEPEDFLPQYQAGAFCCLMRDMYLGCVGESKFADELLRVTKGCAGNVRSEDFDFMLEWHEVLDAVARTINHHIDVGDCKPNPAKVDKFFAVYQRSQQCIDKLVAEDSYAEHLQDRSREVLVSRRENWHTRIGMVERFSSVKFPGDRRV